MSSSRLAFTAWVLALVACDQSADPPAAQPAPAPATAPKAAAEKPSKPEQAPSQAPTVYDFLANRIAQHITLGDALVLDATSPSFWKHIDGGWKSSWTLLARGAGERGALVSGVAGVVHVPVAAPVEDKLLTFTLRSARPDQSLTLFINNKQLTNLAIDENVATYEAKIPADRLVAGDNTVRFHFRAAGEIAGKHSAALFSRITIGPGASARPASAPPEPRTYAIGTDARPALGATSPTAWSYYLVLPSDPLTLEALVGTQSPTPIDYSIRVQIDGADEDIVATGKADPSWKLVAIALDKYAGRAVRLSFAGAGAIGFATPRLIASPSQKPVAQLPTPKPADHVLIWMVDTLRADRLSTYNDKTRVQTPAFTQFAESGVRFASATVQGNYSLPSHASLLTGVYPSVHHMTEDTSRLDPKTEMVSQRFQAAGFATAIFSSNGYISEKWGFKKGWDGYRNFIREELPNSADYVWKTAKPWLEEQIKAKKRTFMYLATVDPHVAYNPPAAFLKSYWPKPYTGQVKPILTAQLLASIKLGRVKLTDNDKQYLEALYDAEVTQNDAAFAKMLEDLATMGIADSTAIIIVSDHGDEFFEHGSVGHGHSVYQELVDIPLLMRYPGMLPAGAVVRTDVEVIDVAPTVLELAGLVPSPAMQGRSLVAYARDPQPRMPRAAISVHGGVLRGVRVGPYKLVTSSARTSLYDLTADPHEQKSLIAQPTPSTIAFTAVRDLFSIHHPYEAIWNKTRWGTAGDLAAAFSEDLLK